MKAFGEAKTLEPTAVVAHACKTPSTSLPSQRPHDVILLPAGGNGVGLGEVFSVRKF